MRRSEVQKMLRKSDIQGDVFSYLWNRRKNLEGSRLKDIANALGRSSDKIKNGLTVLISKEIAIQLCRGVYKVSSEVTK